MHPKRIFVLDGHPAATSLSRTFAETYAERARAAGHEVRLAHLSEMRFDADFGQGSYTDWKPLEPALEQVVKQIEWAEHIVLATPMWWGGMPAKLKGLVDRALLPGRAFDTRVTRMGMPAPMLGGRTARVIVTSDTPGWFLRLVYRNAIRHQVGGQILRFVGIGPVRFTHFTGASAPRAGLMERWIGRVGRLGATAG